MSPPRTTWVLGWGNPGRLDDGLGPAFVEALARHAPAGLVLEGAYQLSIEHAAELGRHARVVLVDAARNGPAPFHLRRVRPGRHGAGFSTHSVSPEALLALGRELFGAEPETWLLGIRGYTFDRFGETLSPRARSNLERALEHLRTAIESGHFEGAPAEDREALPCRTRSA